MAGTQFPTRSSFRFKRRRATGPDTDEVVDDRAHIDYLDAHLSSIAAAVEQGVDVRGYYTWSLMDIVE